MEDDDKGAGARDDDEDDDDEDTIDLDTAKEEEEDDDDDDDFEDDDEDEEDKSQSAEDIERQRLFQVEAEEVLENLTLDDVKEVLKDNDMDASHASKLKKLLVEVINEGEVDTMDDAWDEAIERLED